MKNEPTKYRETCHDSWHYWNHKETLSSPFEAICNIHFVYFAPGSWLYELFLNLETLVLENLAKATSGSSCCS